MNTQLYQTLSDALMTCICPKIHNRLRHHRPDVAHHQQFIQTRRANRIQRMEMLRQRFRRRLTHMTNAQCIHKTRECGVLRGLNRVKHVLCGLLRHALQLRQLRHAQTVQIIRCFHQPDIHQLLNQFIAQPVDIHRLARHKVHQALFQLRRANQAAGATRHRFTLLTHNRRSTFRALRRHHEYARIIRAFLDDAHHHLGNHVARASHHHSITDAHVFTCDFIRVVQRRIGHHHATDLDRCEPRHRRNRPCTPNLNGNILYQGRHLLRRKFMRERPAR